MTKTENRRKKIQMPAGIRQKMMAAVSMLMVSAIMLVSSTYAWFTLSTAPEVAGITTNIGSNGNLEMLLLNGSANADGSDKQGSFYNSEDDLGVKTETGQSMISNGRKITEANGFWGNLVDLTDTSYGLSAITLAPARLNLTSDGGSVGSDTILKAPNYGSDGRVIDVNASTVNGNYNVNEDTYDYNQYHRGVRIIGTSTDVSLRVSTYRSAKSSVTSYINSARKSITASLEENGQALANIVVAYAMDEGTTFDKTDLTALKNVLTKLNSANSDVLSAMKNAVLAYSLSTAQTAELNDEAVKTLTQAVNAVTDPTNLANDSITNVVNPLTGTEELTALNSAISKYNQVNTNIDQALEDVNALLEGTDTSFNFSDIRDIFNNIMDTSKVEVAGITGISSSNIGEIFSYYATNHNIGIVMLGDSGVYADLAELVDDYTVPGLKVFVSYENGDLKLNEYVPIVMSTRVDLGPYVPSIPVGTEPADTSQSADSKITNTYGYALDFGFRTNAADSKLLLQTEAANRVYTDNTTAEGLQGGGSYMQFTSTDTTNFKGEDLLHLMSAIRIAFVTGTETDNQILAVAALDISRTLGTTDGEAKYVVTPGDSVVGYAANGNAIAADDTTTTAVGYKAGLHLYEFGQNQADTKQLTLSGKKSTAEITALTQNKASKITAIVYLDGDIVDNTMVANRGLSLSGKLNLQFSSSATLTPMNNTGILSSAPNNNTGYTERATSGTYTYSNITGTIRDGYTIYEGDTDKKLYFSNDGQNYTRLTTSNYSTVLKDVTISTPATTATSTETPTQPSTQESTEP